MKIWLVDDDVKVLRSLKFRLESRAQEVLCFENLISAKLAVDGLATGESVLVVLDHDFSHAGSDGETGYDFSDYLKRKSWMRFVAPVIYLTGRESRENFISQKVQLAGYAPDVFISKSQLSDNTLETQIDFYRDRIYNFEVAIEDYGLERAIEIFTDPMPR